MPHRQDGIKTKHRRSTLFDDGFNLLHGTTQFNEVNIVAQKMSLKDREDRKFGVVEKRYDNFFGGTEIVKGGSGEGIGATMNSNENGLALNEMFDENLFVVKNNYGGDSCQEEK